MCINARTVTWAIFYVSLFIVVLSFSRQIGIVVEGRSSNDSATWPLYLYYAAFLSMLLSGYCLAGYKSKRTKSRFSGGWFYIRLFFASFVIAGMVYLILLLSGYFFFGMTGFRLTLSYIVIFMGVGTLVLMPLVSKYLN